MHNNYCGNTGGTLTIPTAVPWTWSHCRGITVKFVPGTAELPRLLRYYRHPHSRAPLYVTGRR